MGTRQVVDKVAADEAPPPVTRSSLAVTPTHQCGSEPAFTPATQLCRQCGKHLAGPAQVEDRVA